MEHFYKSIDGWWGTTPDLEIYRLAVDQAGWCGEEAHFVEVGSWAGRSACMMAVNIINSGKRIKLDCVDTWEGSEDGAEHKEMDVIKEGRLYDLFLKNIEPVAHLINPVRMPSVEAAEQYEDSSLDFVFVDGDHTYESVSADIRAWYPKLKPRAMFAGHDFSNPMFGVRQAIEDFCMDVGLSFDVLGSFHSDPLRAVRLSQQRAVMVAKTYDPCLWLIDLANFNNERPEPYLWPAVSTVGVCDFNAAEGMPKSYWNNTEVIR